MQDSSSMGHLGGLFLLISPLICLHIFGVSGHVLPACHKHLEFRCRDGSCVSKLKECDGLTDCADGSDELCGHVRCKEDEFTCHSRRCISLTLLCDGVDDCDDGSDEDSCHKCASGFFSCGTSKICLPRNKLCDGQNDCKDGRDESQELCGSVQPLPVALCASSEFQCGNGECIHHAWRCDHSADCSDASDEENCDIADQDECQINNGGCSHHCLDQPIGFLCGCPDNMKLVEDSQCEEIDVCLESDVCDQRCVSVNASITCKCHEGYHMNPATGECRANDEEAQLVFTTYKGLQLKSRISSEYKSLAPRVPGPGPVAAVASNRTLYWSQQGRGSIYRITVDKKPQKAVLVLRVQGSVSGLDVDWIHRLLYWTSPEKGSINVALLDGSSQHELVTGLDKPSAVALDPLRGFVFWTQCGSAPKIERATSDGHDRTALVTRLIQRPVALSLDLPRQLLYWFDEGMRSISRVTLEGRHRKTVVESNGYLDQLFGLVVFEGYLYWSEEVTHSICRADKHNGRNLQVLLSNVTSPGGLALLHPALQPNGPSACGRSGTVCQHDCVVHLRPERLQFSCDSPASQMNKSQVPGNSRVVPASPSSDVVLAGASSLIMFFSLLLVGMALWWWRVEFRPSRSLTSQSFSLNESQDPLITQSPRVDSHEPEDKHRTLCFLTEETEGVFHT